MPAKDDDRFLMRAGQQQFAVEVVVSEAALRQGLSGRQTLEQGTGMFFIFPNIKEQSMWMKDMNFPLDIVWLDEFLRVVHITGGCPPCLEGGECPTYPSYRFAKYAIELNAGDADALGFREGAAVELIGRL